MSDSRFPTTQWSLVLAAGEGSMGAFDTLYRKYFYPLYAFARRSGDDEATADDLLQGFFLRALEKNDLMPAGPGPGRFRSWLLASFKHYRMNRRKFDRAVKRGGADCIVSLDERDAEARYRCEPTHDQDPERLYLRCWALTVIDNGLGQLRKDYEAGGKARQFEALSVYLTGARDGPAYAEIAPQLEMSEGAVKVAVLRLRKRYSQLLRREVEQTVASSSETDAELRDLFTALA